MADESIAFTKPRKRSFLLQKYHDDLIAFNDQGLTPAAIARAICNKHNLPENTITGKQVSDRKSYLKKEARLNPVPDKFKRRRVRQIAHLLRTRQSSDDEDMLASNLDEDMARWLSSDHSFDIEPVPIIDDEAAAALRPSSRIAAGSADPANHIEIETAIGINEMIGTASEVAEKAQNLFKLVESLSRKLDIDSTEATGAPIMDSEIQAAVTSYSELVLSIEERMMSILSETKEQIKRAFLPDSQSPHYLSAIAINMSVLARAYLLQAIFLNVNSNDEAIRQSVANVNAYIPNIRTHFNSPEDAEKALTIRVQQNFDLTQQYSLEIQKQLRGFFADQINIANGSIPNHLLPDANNGSINISSGKIGYNEAAIDSLKQSIMNLVMTSAKYCDKLIEMNPVPCSSS